MIPLLILALGLSVALATYEFSPTVRARVDEYARAIHEAGAAHRVADAQLSAASASKDPTLAALHVHEATTAKRDAARQTEVAAKTAPTEPQRQKAVESASKVVALEAKIAAENARLGVGQCGVRAFEHVTSRVKDALLKKLHDEGMTVTGNNPWDIATHQFDVKLRAVWDPRARELKLIVTAGKGGLAGLVTCTRIWEKIEPIVKGIIGT